MGGVDVGKEGGRSGGDRLHVLHVRCVLVRDGLGRVRRVRGHPALRVTIHTVHLRLVGSARAERARAPLARHILGEQELLVGWQKGPRLGRVARLPLPGRAAQHEHVAGGHKLRRREDTLLGELRLHEHRRHVFSRTERRVAAHLPHC